MTYELAKELKDAGFPQTGKGNFYGGDGSALGGTTIDVVYKPTLSELIEACVDFPRHQISLYGRNDDRWEATRVRLDMTDYPQLASITKYGVTPEEAVANLWLTLRGSYIVMGGNFAKDKDGKSLVREECKKCDMFLDDSDFHDESGNCL